MGSDINQYQFLIFHACKNMKDLYNSMKQYFQNKQCMTLQNYAQINDSLKVQHRPMDYNVKEYQSLVALFQIPYSNWLQGAITS